MNASPTHSRRRGFALLMTITLLAVIVLLLIGLAAYTRVETAVAGNTQRQAQARENALLALDVALAQLQKHAGPDRRVTATSEWVTGANPEKTHYTGVWNNEAPSDPPAWLVSGLERGATEDLTLAILPAQRVELIGARTSVTANAVVATSQEIRATGVPGAPTNAIIGRYAWWVGDDGVKAPVAIHDRALNTAIGADAGSTITYAPYNSPDARRRIRQQIGLGGGPADPTSGAAIFEPRTSTPATPAPNSTLAANAVASNQLAFFRNPAGAQIGLMPLQQNFFAWAANNAGVLANTVEGGLRRDLSLRPDLLGSAFAAWANYSAYLEDPANPLTPAIVPAYGSDPIRRRMHIRPPLVADGITFKNAPVLSFFFLQFNVRRVGGGSSATTNAIEVRARMVTQLWNPHTTAIVPEDLTLEISGLPVIRVNDSLGGVQQVDLGTLFGAPMVVQVASTDLSPGDADDQSWLPGRVYYWRTGGGAMGAWTTEFYNRDINVASANVWVVPAGVNHTGPPSNAIELWVTGPGSRLSIALKRSDGTLLSMTHSPNFADFETEHRRADSNDEYRFGFPFRFADAVDFAAGAGGGIMNVTIDPRSATLSDPLVRTLAGGDLPSAYVGNSGNASFNDPNRLLDRAMGTSGMSYNEDVPVFELPRAPLLSLGSLQHLHIDGARAFAIGNPWGNSVTLGTQTANSLFDKFYFSGFDPTVLTGLTDAALAAPFTMPMPNPLLAALPRTPAGMTATLGDILGKPTSITDVSNGFSSRLLLQRGAFNFNAVNPRAWLAMLRSTRFANGETFRYLNASTGTGTNADSESTLSPSPADAVFYRFPQSAQETYEADLPVDIDVGGLTVRSTYAASNTATGTAPNVPSSANTHLFRRGMRGLTASETVAFANDIAAKIRAKLGASGPFRSMEEFLNPLPLFAGGASGAPRSLIEAAIEDVRLNAAVPEFSSQFLTQGDVVTALAPFLFPRSDTFTIRAYGEAVNPTTNGVEGRAWCEATVQRLPEYFDKSQPEETPPAELNQMNQLYGRRFKVVAFRWLTRSDI